MPTVSKREIKRPCWLSITDDLAKISNFEDISDGAYADVVRTLNDYGYRAEILMDCFQKKNIAHIYIKGDGRHPARIVEELSGRFAAMKGIDFNCYLNQGVVFTVKLADYGDSYFAMHLALSILMHYGSEEKWAPFLQILKPLWPLDTSQILRVDFQSVEKAFVSCGKLIGFHYTQPHTGKVMLVNWPLTT